MKHVFSLFCSLLLVFSCDRISPDNNSLPHLESNNLRLETRAPVNSPSPQVSRITKTHAFDIVRDEFPDKQLVSLETIRKHGKVVLYVANFEAGWALVSADARADTILAYSEQGSFDPDDIPNPGARYWFEMIKSEIDSLPEETESSSFDKDDNPEMRLRPRWFWIRTRLLDSLINETLYESGHLMSTTWGQGNPWNVDCPVYYDSGSYYHCPTGCAATAMSQILYYLHNQIGKPTGLYHTVGFANQYILYQNPTFFRSNFMDPSSRWNDMPLDKTGLNTDYVADLMVDVGNRLNVSYTPTGSGAVSSKSAYASYGVVCDSASYSVSTVLSSLRDGMPVMVRADDEYGFGHAWVIDGIKENQSVYAYEDIWHLVYTDEPGVEAIEFYIPEQMDLIDPDMYDGKTVTGTYTVFSNSYILMNWGYDDNAALLSYNNVYYSAWNNASWTIDGSTYSDNKRILYNFR